MDQIMDSSLLSFRLSENDAQKSYSMLEFQEHVVHSSFLCSSLDDVIGFKRWLQTVPWSKDPLYAMEAISNCRDRFVNSRRSSRWRTTLTCQGPFWAGRFVSAICDAQWMTRGERFWLKGEVSGKLFWAKSFHFRRTAHLTVQFGEEATYVGCVDGLSGRAHTVTSTLGLFMRKESPMDACNVQDVSQSGETWQRTKKLFTRRRNLIVALIANEPSQSAQIYQGTLHFCTVEIENVIVVLGLRLWSIS